MAFVYANTTVCHQKIKAGQAPDFNQQALPYDPKKEPEIGSK